jgi:hypothetical protein
VDGENWEMLLNVHHPFSTLRDITRTLLDSAIVMNKLSRPWLFLLSGS